MLPGLDGMEICRRIRAESGVPIVMLTAINGPGGGGMPVVFTLTKDNSDTPSSEVTPTDFGIQGFTIGEGFSGSGVFRYCHFFAVARDLAGSIVATPATG